MNINMNILVSGIFTDGGDALQTKNVLKSDNKESEVTCCCHKKAINPIKPHLFNRSIHFDGLLISIYCSLLS